MGLPRLIWLGCLLLVTACSRSEQRQTVAPSPAMPLRICTGTTYSVLLAIAEQKGLFARQGLKVELFPFAVGRDAMEAMLADKCEVATSADTPVADYGRSRDDLRIIAGIAKQGLWQTTDGGKTWTPLGQGAGSDVIVNRPSRIEYDPTSSDTFWESGIYNSSGVYRTTNGGMTFQHLGIARHNDFVSVDFSDPQRRTMPIRRAACCARWASKRCVWRIGCRTDRRRRRGWDESSP